MSGWIGVDLDGTLAHYEGWRGIDHIGDPVPGMAFRVRKWLADGRDVRIFTARVSGSDNAAALHHIDEWCVRHFGQKLAVTCTKDFAMVELWDDRCVRVMPNTGEPCCGRQPL